MREDPDVRGRHACTQGMYSGEGGRLKGGKVVVSVTGYRIRNSVRPDDTLSRPPTASPEASGSTRVAHKGTIHGALIVHSWGCRASATQMAGRRSPQRTEWGTAILTHRMTEWQRQATGLAAGGAPTGMCGGGHGGPTQANDYCIRLPLTCVRKIVAPKVGHHAFQQRIRHLVGERCGWLRGERRSRGDPMPGLDVSLEPSKVQMFIDMNMVRECGSYSGSYPRQLRPRRYSAASAQHAGTPVEHGSLRPAPASPTVCTW